jgi:transposase, IS6 family
MSQPNSFKWRHFEANIILLCLRWYLRYPLSYRDLEEMLSERGLWVDHTTISRWLQRSCPELEKRCRPHLKRTNDSWRVDETSVKGKGGWMYLYRAVDSEGNTLEFRFESHARRCGRQRVFPKEAESCSHGHPSRDHGRQKRGLPQGARRPEKCGGSATLLPAAASEVAQHQHRARPPLHQTPHQTRTGIFLPGNGMANAARV